MDRATIEGMIHDVNSTQVPPKDILSEHAYMYDAQEHELMRADRYEARQVEKQADKAVAVGEIKAAYEVKVEKTDAPREKKSVRAQISEKKAIISKTAAEKTAPVKDHQISK
jgi:hypothetical protein